MRIREYRVKRKIQEQKRSYFVTLPKIWVESLGLKQSDEVLLVFNGIVKVIPPASSAETKPQEEAKEVEATVQT